MSKGRRVRCFDYVNHPYEQVRDVLSTSAVEVFGEATQAAATRAQKVASTLHVNLGGIEVGTAISIAVKEIEEDAPKVRSAPVTRLRLEWEATKSPRLFPFMNAELAIYPLTASETQLDFKGEYEPPLGALGSAVDAIVGHRIAEVSVHRFVNDVADYLRKTLADSPVRE